MVDVLESPSPVEQLVDAAPVEIDDDMVLRLIYDLAQRIHTAETIAKRYGFQTEPRLKKWLGEHPTVVRQAAKLQAIVNSDRSAEERARLKATFATEELIAPMAAIAGNPTVPAGQRIDAFKQLNRVAGVDGMPVSQKDGGGSGTQFNLTINMPDGRTEKIITTVVDPASLPAPAENDE
jgi:hypothetical protein